MNTSDQRKIKGINFAEQIENGQIFKKFIQLTFDNQKGEKMPIEFIKATALSPLQIIQFEGKNCLKNYMYNGTYSHFEFMNDSNFIQSLEYVDRPKIRKVKH